MEGLAVFVQLIYVLNTQTDTHTFCFYSDSLFKPPIVSQK